MGTRRESVDLRGKASSEVKREVKELGGASQDEDLLVEGVRVGPERRRGGSVDGERGVGIVVGVSASRVDIPGAGIAVGLDEGVSRGHEVADEISGSIGKGIEGHVPVMKVSVLPDVEVRIELAEGIGCEGLRAGGVGAFLMGLGELSIREGERGAVVGTEWWDEAATIMMVMELLRALFFLAPVVSESATLGSVMFAGAESRGLGDLEMLEGERRGSSRERVLVREIVGVQVGPVRVRGELLGKEILGAVGSSLVGGDGEVDEIVVTDGEGEGASTNVVYLGGASERSAGTSRRSVPGSDDVGPEGVSQEKMI